MTKIIRFFTGLIGLLLVFACGGVYAAWRYDDFLVDGESADASLQIREFLYSPDEILPDDDVDSQLGKNHRSILDEILYNDKYGLNPTTTLPENMARYNDLINCYENGIHGGNMNNIPRAGNLGFVITCTREEGEIVSYYLYTFDAFASYTVGSSLTVYRTYIVQDSTGEWYAPLSWEGYVIATQDSIVKEKSNCYILPTYWVQRSAALIEG